MRAFADRILDRIWRNGLERVTRFRWMDRLYTRIAFWFEHGRFPDTCRPETFRDHLMRIKLSPEIRSPLRLRVSDKEHVKEYISDLLGAAYIVPTIAVLQKASEIDSFAFPDICIIKPTHASGMRLYRRGGDVAVDRTMLKTWLAHNHYPERREENYRYLTPKIIVEELLLFGGKLPLDYKIHCFHGRPKLIHVIEGTLTGEIASAIYSPKWEPIPIAIKKPGGLTVAHPRNLSAIVDAAARISAAFNDIRVDLYTDGDRIYIGELTNLPAAGSLRFDPPEADRLCGVFFRNPDADPVELFARLPERRH